MAQKVAYPGLKIRNWGDLTILPLCSDKLMIVLDVLFLLYCLVDSLLRMNGPG